MLGRHTLPADEIPADVNEILRIRCVIIIPQYLNWLRLLPSLLPQHTEVANGFFLIHTQVSPLVSQADGPDGLNTFKNVIGGQECKLESFLES